MQSLQNVHKGCPEYIRLMSEGANAPSPMDMLLNFQMATNHRKTCPECQAAKQPLAEQWFCVPVVVIEEEVCVKKTQTN